MEEVLTLPVPTISHVPHKARPLLSHVLTTELRHARQDGLGGFVRLSLLAKATLRTPPRGGGGNVTQLLPISPPDSAGGRRGTSSPSGQKPAQMPAIRHQARTGRTPPAVTLGGL